MEHIGYGTLEGGSHILESKGHNVICECPPRGGKIVLYWSCWRIPIWLDPLPLVEQLRPLKYIYEREDLMASALINDLINERG